MQVHVLGSGAGGGLPQWNCGCENCALVRAGDARIAPRTQDSIAITSTGDRWLVINASPDVLRQIEHFEPLWPRAQRHTPIGAITLTNGDLDHVVGLLSLRESQPLRILATDRVRAGLTGHNAMLRTLERTVDQVTWTHLELGREVALDDIGVGVTAHPAPGKLPVHLAALLDPSPEDNVALRVRDLATGRSVVIATAMGALDGAHALAQGADAVFFDGTFWSEDELVARGLGKARAGDMAHVPVGGPAGSLAYFGSPSPAASAMRRVYTHINNTNPILRSDARECAEVLAAGWEIALDGMDLWL
ncbi:MAG: pyrroloquinoline quinone biosynthesis protein PqqB [Polyangiaceae bacterium]